MIYLIGGTMRVGKSIVAKKIAKNANAMFISTDDVCGQIIERLPKEQRDHAFPFHGFSGNASENTFSPKEYVELQIVCANSLQSALVSIIQDAILKNESLVIEGVQLLPTHVRSLMTNHGVKKFRSLFIGSTEEDRIVEGIMQNTSPDNWTRESDPKVIRQIAECAAAWSVYIKKEAQINNLPYEERTANFEGDLARFCEYLEKTENKLPLR